jgi:lysozyme family protein
MSKSNFEACLREVLKHEGGFVNHPKDPGGATNLGITKATLEAYRGRKVTVAEVRALTVAEAAKIYHQNYWQTIKGDTLPSGLDMCVFDCAVNSGPSHALAFLRQVMNDRAVASTTPSHIRAYGQKRLAFLMRLPTWTTFGRGWHTRVKEVEQYALKMIPHGE